MRIFNFVQKKVKLKEKKAAFRQSASQVKHRNRRCSFFHDCPFKALLYHIVTNVSTYHAELKVSHNDTAKSSKKNDLKKKRKGKKKQLFPSLADMAVSLGNLGEHNDLAMKIKTVKSLKDRERIMADERERMQMVFRAPEFQSNPLKAIMGHLEATLPPPPNHSANDEKMRT